MSDDEYYTPVTVPSQQIEVVYDSDELPPEKPKSKCSHRTQKQREAFEEAGTYKDQEKASCRRERQREREREKEIIATAATTHKLTTHCGLQ